MKIRGEFVDNIAIGSAANRILILLGLNLMIIFMLRYFLPVVGSLIGNKLEEQIKISTMEEISRKKNEIPFFYHEDREIRDSIDLAESGPEEIWNFWRSSAQLLSSVLSVIIVFFVLGELGSAISCMLFVVFIPVAAISIKAGKRYYNTWARTATLRRHCDDQRDVLLDKAYAQERLHYGFGKFFMDRWQKEYHEVRALSIKEELKGAKFMQLGGVLVCVYISILIYIMVDKFMVGEVSVGYVISVLSIVPKLFYEIIQVSSDEINKMVRAVGSIGALGNFYGLEEEKGAWEVPKEGLDFNVIEFRNVSFRYPGTEKWILRNLSMKIERGKHYALVGENGAGKSTIIKLILQLYPVTEGAIYIDGKNMNMLDRAEVAGIAAALFQDYQRYLIRVDENIGIGNILQMNEVNKIKKSAQAIGLDERIERLPSGYQTMLGGIYANGVNLSGGEWQKLALSRLLMSSCQLVILDEPTASMDPIFEQKLYEDFLTLFAERTTISISHRLASCRNADCIYVIGSGGIIEQGSHEKLMEQAGVYAKMFEIQKRRYEEGWQ